METRTPTTDRAAPARHLRVVTMDEVVRGETPAQHVRNAVQLLVLVEQLHPAVWVMTPELSRALRCATYAIRLLEPLPSPYAASHLQRAIRALLESDVEWDVIPDVRNATARLLHALFMLNGEAP